MTNPPRNAVVERDRARKRRPPRPELTPAQRVAAAHRARQLREGEIVIPLSCPSCYSNSLERGDRYEGGLRCLSCARVTTVETAKTIRKQRIRRFLLDGSL